MRIKAYLKLTVIYKNATSRAQCEKLLNDLVEYCANNGLLTSEGEIEIETYEASTIAKHVD